MPQVLIVNNSLKDLRGHFFETSLAVAEAVRDLGWRPVLGAHVSCPRDVIPDWLTFHPVFTTDHWMVSPLPRLVQFAESMLPLRWHQPAHRLLRAPWRVLSSGRQTLQLRKKRECDPLAASLRRAGVGQEFEYVQRFQHDLAQFLSLCLCQPEDHVFLPTAHGRELAAIKRLCDERHGKRLPTFHLEFRHDLERFRYQVRHRVFFDHVSEIFSTQHIRLYTDTEELADEYQRFSGLPFGVLPIPFRARLLPRPRHAAELCLAYFGDVRDEKGFHWLPDLARGLPASARLLVQASLDPLNRNPRSTLALRRLKEMRNVTLFGEDGPLSPEAYFEFMAQATVLLCPYDAIAYRGRSSGTFAEALAGGIPTVVPANTWMARQQPHGSGESFTDKSTFISAVNRICPRIDEYRAAAAMEATRWLARHSPKNLVQSLVTC